MTQLHKGKNTGYSSAYVQPYRIQHHVRPAHRHLDGLGRHAVGYRCSGRTAYH